MFKKFLIILSVPIVFLLSFYATGIIHYRNRFLPNTTINHIDVSEMTIEEAEQEFLKLSEQSLTVEGRGDYKEEIPLKTIEYRSMPSKSFEYMQKEEQNTLLWPKAFTEVNHIEAQQMCGYSYPALKQNVDSFGAISGEQAEQPKDAYITKVENHYEIVQEEEGNLLDEESVLKKIQKRLNDSESMWFDEPVDVTDCYVEPKVRHTDSELVKTIDKISQYEHQSVTVNLIGATEVFKPIDNGLMTFEDNEIKIHDEVITEFVKDLSTKYNTYETKRKFVTHSGNVIEVGGYGHDTYGFQLDIGKTEDALRAALDKGGEQEIDAVWKIPARTRDKENGDIGGTYIEVSIEDQHMWYFEKGDLVLDTDVVTGKLTESRKTPRGLFRVWSKETNKTLRGSYGSSFVNYWMAVTWTGVGIHDAPWRSSYGGSIYKSNGSHGCINTPYAKAKELYGMVKYDTPVVVY